MTSNELIGRTILPQQCKKQPSLLERANSMYQYTGDFCCFKSNFRSCYRYTARSFHQDCTSNNKRLTTTRSFSKNGREVHQRCQGALPPPLAINASSASWQELVLFTTARVFTSIGLEAAYRVDNFCCASNTFAACLLTCTTCVPRSG